MPDEINSDYTLMSPSQYFREYRRLLGFTNQGDAKSYLGAKDIVPPVDEGYLSLLLERIREIVQRYGLVISDVLQPDSIEDFVAEKVDYPLDQIQAHGLLPRLNNQGRRPEQVLFSWLRGYSTAEYFLPSLKAIFGANGFETIGQDDFSSAETFKRTPTADYLVTRETQPFRIEVQSGFQPISDVKQHKVLEAKRVFRDERVATVCVHLDLFNGQCAFVRLDTIDDGDVNWVTRTQMEGQYVFSIEQNYFKWRLADRVPLLDELELGL